MSLIPGRFLVRLAHPCPFVARMPSVMGDHLVDLPESGRLENLAGLGEQANFAEVRLGWNESGLGVQVEVRGKDQPPRGDASKPRSSDGLTLWIDTRDSRASHRASRYCHQWHLLPTGGGDDHDEPCCVAVKINRAVEDAPLTPTGVIPVRVHPLRGGYRLEAFFPAARLNGYDPDQNPRLGVYYVVRDAELGDQYLGVGGDFPY
jgi:hypothetical protein